MACRSVRLQGAGRVRVPRYGEPSGSVGGQIMKTGLRRTGVGVALSLLLVGAAVAAGVNPAPPRRPGEGLGPFHTLIIHGATPIDGTRAPPVGPVDIVIHDNLIAEIRESAR